MLVDKENIHQYIPQKDPFVMVDGLIEKTENGFKTKYKVSAENVLLKNSELSENALIECVAQSCALGFGYEHKSKGNTDTPLGFIGAVSKLEIFDSVILNDLLIIEIKLITSFDIVQLIEGTVYKLEKPVMKCQMKIVSP